MNTVFKTWKFSGVLSNNNISLRNDTYEILAHSAKKAFTPFKVELSISNKGFGDNITLISEDDNLIKRDIISTIKRDEKYIDIFCYLPHGINIENTCEKVSAIDIHFALDEKSISSTGTLCFYNENSEKLEPVYLQTYKYSVDTEKTLNIIQKKLKDLEYELAKSQAEVERLQYENEQLKKREWTENSFVYNNPFSWSISKGF